MNAERDIVKLSRDGIAAAGGIDPSRPVGVALSGGADSVALLSLLNTLGYKCVALHCNFHLRGEESDRDENHARSVAALLGTPIEVAQMDVPERQKETGESIEMVCRELRYRWFAEKAESLGLQAVAVAHHRDDQVETFFLNLLRGGGARGLAAMKPRNGLIVRPLLGITRSEIESYLTREGLGYVTDSTNATNLYKRNRLRNELIPMLNRLFPGAADSISQSINNLRKQATLLDDVARDLHNQYVDSSGNVMITKLMTTERHPVEALYELLAPMGFNRSVIDDVAKSARQSGRRFQARDREYILERGALKPYFECHLSESHEGLESPIATVEIIDREDVDTLKCPADTLLLDATALEGNPAWEWRPWREGDRLAPYGMRGTRLLSDIFSDLHLPLQQRQSLRVLTRDGVVIWIPGIRASRHFPITEATRKVVRLKLS